MKEIFYVSAALLAGNAVYVVYIYNLLVRKKANADNGWSQIDVQQRRST